MKHNYLLRIFVLFIFPIFFYALFISDAQAVDTPVINGTSSAIPPGFVTLPSGTPPCALQGAEQTCSVTVLPTMTSNSSACNFDISQKNSYFQQNVSGTGPVVMDINSPDYGKPIVSGYNPINYATQSAAAQLAQCLGGSVVTTSNMGPESRFYIPPTYEIVLPNGFRENAGYMIDRYFASGSNPTFFQNYVAQLSTGSSGTGATSGTSVTTGTGATSGSGTSSSGTGSTSSGTALQDQQKIINSTKNLVNKFQQQLNSLQGVSVSPTLTDQSNTPTSSLCPKFNTNLRLGDSGSSVTQLTGVLVKEGLMTAAQSTFDQKVFDAVVSYQEKYASQILTPLGLDRGTGFFGPSTRGYMNSNLTCSAQ